MSDYWTLIRPRIIAMVLLSMTVAAWTAGPKPPCWPLLIHALAGTALVIAGAIALNQRLEHTGDAKMARTAGRPLPTGRLARGQVTRFGLAASAAGFAYLGCLAAFSGTGLLVVLAAVSWIVYLGTYTPLKVRTPWQTPVGALAGAMPTMLGAATVMSPASVTALSLFGTVYLWQFPHSMAIAWLYRHEFASAEVKLATVVDPSGRTAGALALLGAVLLLPVSLLPAMLASLSWQYGLAAMMLGSGYLALAAAFFLRPGDRRARRLLHASLLYLPALFAAMLLAHRG